MRTLFAAATFVILLVSCQTQQRSGSARGVEPLTPRADAGAEAVTLPPPPVRVPPQLDFDRQVEALLDSMTLRQKIGQRFMTGFPGRRAGDRVLRLIREGSIGGLLLTRGNIQNRAQVKELTAALQSAAAGNSPAIGLFIAVDQEGGRVTRLDLENVTRFAAPYHWSEYRDPSYVESIGYIAGKEVLALGCNMNLAPVLDLYGVADSSVIGDRSMGLNPFRVGEQGVFYLYGARRAGIASVVKHFPGHGSTSVDSHHELPVVEADEAELRRLDLIPFQLAIDHGVEAVMTAHLLLPKLDPDYPVTLSEPIIRGLLRGRLGFRGVVVTDDIDMGALQNHFTPRQIVEHSIRAGVDLILGTGGLDAMALIAEAEALVESGVLSQEQIEEGTRRLLRLKLKYGLLPAPQREGGP